VVNGLQRIRAGMAVSATQVPMERSALPQFATAR